MDTLTPESRHLNISHIRSRDTKPEKQIRSALWRAKFMRNKERDVATIRYYQDQCWRICVVWECAIRGKKIRQKIENVADRISLWLEEPDEPFLDIRG